MYCDRCGSLLPSGSQFCRTCGRAVLPGVGGRSPVALRAAPDGRVGRNLNVLSWLWLASGLLRLAEVGWFYFVGRTFIPSLVGSVVAGIVPFGHGWGAERFATFGLWSALFYLALFGGLHILLAWGLFERARWARVLGLALAFLAVLRFPFGTALGIYTIWVLLPEPAGREYDTIAQAS